MLTVVRPEQPGDTAAIAAVHDAAFGGGAEAVLVERVRHSPGFVPALSLVAEDDGDVVGHLLLSRVALGDATALALAPIGVRPDRQRRGVGGALIRRGVADATAAGERLVVVVGHPAYYPRFGFAAARPLGILPPFAVPDDAWLALPLAGDWPRGTVRYPPAFDEV